MLERYTLPPMAALWSTKYKYDVWASIATAQAAARLDAGREQFQKELLAYPVPTEEQVASAEAETRHDVAAFLRAWRKGMKPEHARQIHTGLTSSDLVDTAQSVILSQISDQIIHCLDRLITRLAKSAVRYWSTERVGRTHGQPAEMTTLGYQLARHCAAFVGNGERFVSAVDDISVVKMSGPVGAYRFTSLEQERTLAKLVGEGFSATEVAGQRIAREGYARWVSELAIMATSVEDLALQFRLGQQFGIQELFEPFAPGQVGSSSMPHKRNPIRSETMTGLARLVRAQVVPVMEGIPTWGERDITHSSVERVALPTASILTHYLIANAYVLVDGLRYDPIRMDSNAKLAREDTSTASFKAMMVQDAGIDHELADRIVQEAQAGGRGYLDKAIDNVLGIGPHVPPAPRISHAYDLMREVIDSAQT